jgi:HEAT repeats
MTCASIMASVAKAFGLGKGKGKGSRGEIEVRHHISRLANPNPEVRRSACWSLGKLDVDPDKIVPELDRIAKSDPEPFVAKSARWAIKRIRQ